MGGKNIILNLGSLCNNDCWFCIYPKKSPKFKSFEEIKKDIDKIKTKKSIIIAGGEPTIHPKILDVVSYLKQSFDNISLLTNGRMFFYPSFCKEITQGGITNFFVKIQGHTEQIHDPLTRVDRSFKQTVKGIKNLINLGCSVNSYTTTTEQNFIFLPKIIDFLNNLGIKSIYLSMPKPTGNSLTTFEKLTPRYSEIKSTLIEAIEKNKSKIYIEDMPYCFVGEDYEKDIVEIFNNKESKIKPKECNSCTKKQECSGIWKEYIDIYGTSEINPILDHPEEIAIEVTSACDLNCSLCFNKNYYNKTKKKEPSLEETKKIIDKIPLNFVSHIRFTGGEPLLRKDIFEILDYAKSKGFTIWFNTNGTLITKEIAEKLAKYIDNVLLPLNSYDEKSELRASGKKCFEIKLNGMRLLKQAGIKTVRAGTIATKDNIKNLEKIYSVAQKLNLDDWELYRPIPNKKNQKNITKEDIKLLTEKLIILEKIFGKKYFIVNALPFCSYDPKKINQVAKGAEADDGHIRFVIGADFKAKPSYFIKKTIGDIRENSVRDIWNNSFMTSMRNLKLAPKECKNCNYLRICKGGSRFIARMVNGSYTNLDPLSNPKII